MKNATLGLLLTGVLFLVLPMFHLVADLKHKRLNLVLVEMSRPPPPAPPEQQPPPVEEDRLIERPVLKQKQPKLTLAQLELALDPGMGDASAGGDFSIDFKVDTMDEIEMIYDISEVDRIPRAVFMASPVYPPDLKRKGITGIVTLLFVCTPKGAVRHIQVRSSDHVSLEVNAIKALRRWRFRPGLKDGKKVNVRMLIPFHFGDPL